MLFSQMLFALVLSISMNLCNTIPLWKHSILKRSTSVVEFRMNQEHLQQLMTDAAEDEEALSSSYEHSCTEAITDPNAPVNMRSTCPWFYSSDRNNFRYPVILPIAKLRCGTTCLPANSTDGQVHECVPINKAVDILVQKRIESNDYVYEEMEVQIPVGFTCSGRKIANSGPATTPSTPETTTEDIFN